MSERWDLAVCPGLPEVGSPAFVLPVTTTSDFVVLLCDGCEVGPCTMDGRIHVEFRPTSIVSLPSSLNVGPYGVNRVLRIRGAS
jgi:hypothetical protein